MLMAVTRKVLLVLIWVTLLCLLASVGHGQILKDVYDFGASAGDGSSPNAALLMDSAGNLYGTTKNGGNGAGTVFELVNSNGTYTEKILYTFNTTDGYSPQASLAMDSAGNLFGTTYSGGLYGMGTVFELVNSNGAYTWKALYNFAGSDGAYPYSGVVFDSAGNLYGTTNGGGTSNAGTVYELVNVAGNYTEQLLYSFSGADGSFPYTGNLFMDASGNLYGTTLAGGTSNVGTVFKLTNMSGTYVLQTLHSFAGPDGSYPYSGLISDAAGNLYGTTAYGGVYGYGAVFMLSKGAGYSLQLMHSFTGTDGAYPFAGLAMDAAQNLYGTTSYDFSLHNGTIFELGYSSGRYTSYQLGQFCTALQSPHASLVVDSAGNLYGSVSQGGANSAGAIFRFATVSAAGNATSTVLTSSPNPAKAGDTIVLTAAVSSAVGYPQGSVTFSTGSLQLGRANLNCGAASTTIEEALTLGVGSATITAQYTPSASYFAASSGSANEFINEPGVVLTNGGNTLTGNQTINGVVSATSFVGDGSGLSNVNAATAVAASGLSCVGCVGNQQLSINYAASASQGGDANNALKLQGHPAGDFQPAGSYAITGPNIFLGGQSIFGALSLNSTGTATASQPFNSDPLDSIASVFNSSLAKPQSHRFRWQVEPVPSSNNTANPTSTLNLLFDSNGTPAETGLSVNANGTFNFAPGQSFPVTESEVSGLSTDLSDKIATSAIGAPSGVASLDSNGKIPASELPQIAAVPAVLTGWCSGTVASTNGAVFAFTGLSAAVGTAGTTCANGSGSTTVIGIPITSPGTLANLYVYPGKLGNSGTNVTFTVYKAAAPGWSMAANQTAATAVSFAASTRTVTLTIKSGAQLAIGNQINVSGISGSFNSGANCPTLAGSSFTGTYTVKAQTSTTVAYLDTNLPSNCGSNISNATTSGTVSNMTSPTLNTVTRTLPTATALGCTIGAMTGIASATCADTTDTVSVTAGDVISLVGRSARSSGTETIGDIRVSLEKK